jgi:hypothetical protein
MSDHGGRLTRCDIESGHGMVDLDDLLLHLGNPGSASARQ